MAFLWFLLLLRLEDAIFSDTCPHCLFVVLVENTFLLLLLEKGLEVKVRPRILAQLAESLRAPALNGRYVESLRVNFRETHEHIEIKGVHT